MWTLTTGNLLHFAFCTDLLTLEVQSIFNKNRKASTLCLSLHQEACGSSQSNHSGGCVRREEAISLYI